MYACVCLSSLRIKCQHLQPGTASCQDGARREVNLIPNAQIEDELFNTLADKKVDVVARLHFGQWARSWWLQLQGVAMCSLEDVKHRMPRSSGYAECECGRFAVRFLGTLCRPDRLAHRRLAASIRWLAIWRQERLVCIRPSRLLLTWFPPRSACDADWPVQVLLVLEALEATRSSLANPRLASSRTAMLKLQSLLLHPWHFRHVTVFPTVLREDGDTKVKFADVAGAAPLLNHTC